MQSRWLCGATFDLRCRLDVSVCPTGIRQADNPGVQFYWIPASRYKARNVVLYDLSYISLPQPPSFSFSFSLPACCLIPLLIGSWALLLPILLLSLSFPLSLPSMVHYSLLLLLVVWIEDITAAGGVLEVDLVFPRNETYAPTTNFSLVFAFHNSQLAQYVNPYIEFVVEIASGPGTALLIDSFDLQSTNFSTNNPYFLHRCYPSFQIEAFWRLVWTLYWDNCTQNSLADMVQGVEATTRHDMTRHTAFSTKNGSQAVDLVAATTNQNCSSLDGMVINIVNTVNIPSSVEGNRNGTCAVMASTTPSPESCRVKIDAAAAASITNQIEHPGCDPKVPTKGCPSSKTSSARWLAVEAITVAFGILSWVLF